MGFLLQTWKMDGAVRNRRVSNQAAGGNWFLIGSFANKNTAAAEATLATPIIAYRI